MTDNLGILSLTANKEKIRIQTASSTQSVFSNNTVHKKKQCYNDKHPNALHLKHLVMAYKLQS